MLLMPELELGLWNAWIFMLYVVFSNFLPYVLSGKLIDTRVLKKLGADLSLSDNEKKLLNIYSVLFFAIIAYSIFVPLELGTVWFYVGLIIYLLGVIIETVAMLDFFTTAVDKPINKGIYRFSRTPTYVGMILMYAGVGIACSSWLLLLLTAVLIILLNAVLPSEERYCLYRFGNEYRKYKNRTPRWIGFPKSSKIED